MKIFRSPRLKEAEDLLKKISEGDGKLWQTIAALRYFGWTWDEKGHAIEPEENK